jgi:hypothetical protein
MKAGLGMFAGGAASLFGTPAEISLIRMTSDGRLPVKERHNYKHVFDALARITREEGVTTLWRVCFFCCCCYYVVVFFRVAVRQLCVLWLSMLHNWLRIRNRSRFVVVVCV